MLKFISCVATLLLFCNFSFSQDSHLQCYSCAHVETGDIKLVEGFQNSSVDESCKWGNRPDERFLINCTSEYEIPGYQYFYACVQMKVNGIIISGGKQSSAEFNGTLWGCATRRVITQLPIIDYNSAPNFVSKECRQGALSAVKDNFKAPTGREFLQNMSTVFDPFAKVKFCTCDYDACWDKGPPTTTSAASTTLAPTTEPTFTSFIPTSLRSTSSTETEYVEGAASMKNTSLLVCIINMMTVAILTIHLSSTS